MNLFERLLAIFALLADAEQVAALPDVLPEDADEDAVSIESLSVELLDAFDAVRAGECELPPDADPFQVCSEIAEQHTNLQALQYQHDVAAVEAEQLAAQRAADLDALRNNMAGAPDAEPTEPEAVEPAEPAEPAPTADAGTDDGAQAEATAEPIAASVQVRPALGQARGPARLPSTVRVREQQRRDNPSVAITATAGGRIAPADVGQAVARGYREQGANSGKRAHVTITASGWDEAHTFRSEEQDFNLRKQEALIDEAQTPGAWEGVGLTAGGLGWCVPSQVDYSEAVQALAIRPARAMLPSINIDHGGVKVAQNPTLSDINFDQTMPVADQDDTAVVVYTEANDIAADPDVANTLKPSQKISCTTYNDFRAYAIVRRLRFDNFAARSNPEHVATFNELVAAAYARVADTRILDLIKDDAGTTNVVETETLLGSTRDLLEMILRLAAFMRSAERASDGMGGGPAIRVALPAWSLGMNQADLVRTFRDFDGPSNNLVVPTADIIDMLRSAGVNPSFYIDSPSTGPTQLLRKQVDGQRPAFWPCAMQYGMWFEGHFAHGDVGVLDAGTIRDTSLNDVNDYETFYEGFETVVAHRGPEALWVTQDLSPNGSYAASIDISSDLDCS